MGRHEDRRRRSRVEALIHLARNGKAIDISKVKQHGVLVALKEAAAERGIPLLLEEEAEAPTAAPLAPTQVDGWRQRRRRRLRLPMPSRRSCWTICYAGTRTSPSYGRCGRKCGTRSCVRGGEGRGALKQFALRIFGIGARCQARAGAWARACAPNPKPPRPGVHILPPRRPSFLLPPPQQRPPGCKPGAQMERPLASKPGAKTKQKTPCVQTGGNPKAMPLPM